MKAFRIALAVLTGAILLLIIAAVIFIRTFDLNDYKDEIATYVEGRTGRALAIDDNIEFSLFPWFAVETGGVSLSDDPAFGERSFLTAETLSARVRVWPLLRRRIEIGRVILDGINLNLGLDDDGRGNWASLLESEAPDAAPIEISESDQPTINALAIEGIELRNARILWHDPSGEVVYLVRDLTLVTGPVENDEPVELSAAFGLLDVASQAVAEFELEAKAVLRPAVGLEGIDASVRVIDARDQERAEMTMIADSISFTNGILSSGPTSVNGVVRRAPIGPAAFALAAEFSALSLDRASETLTIDGLTASSGGVDASLEISGSGMLSHPALSGSARLESDRIAAFFDTLGIEAPPLIDLASGDPGGLVLSLDFDARPPARTFSIARYAVSGLDVDAGGSAELGADGLLVASIEIPSFRPSPRLIDTLSPSLPEGLDPAGISSLEFAASLTFDTTSRRLDIGEYSAAIDTLDVSGRFEIDNVTAAESYHGNLIATGLDNRLLDVLFGAWLPSGLIDAELGTFRLAADFVYSPRTQTAEFAPLELSAYGLSGDGELALDLSETSPALSGRAEIAAFSPRELLSRFSLPTPQSADPSVLGTAELAASFDASGSAGEFRDIAFRLDDSRITGEFRIENFSDPAYDFVLRADRIDVDRYLPPRREQAAAAGAIAAAPVLGEMRLAPEAMTNTVVDGTASVGRLTIGGMTFEQLTTELTLGGGQAALDSVQTALYGGDFRGMLSIDATGESSSVHLTGDATDVAIQPLLSAMLGAASFSGTGNVTLDLTGRGATINEVLESARGSLDFSFTDGEIEGMNFGYELCRTVNTANGLAPPAAGRDSTAYSVIRGSAIVTDGIARSSDLYATTGYLTLTGSGNTRIVDQRIDHRYRADLTAAIPIEGCDYVNRRIASNPVPFNFAPQGRLPDVELNFDLGQFLRDLARREVRQRAEESLRDALIDRVFN